MSRGIKLGSSSAGGGTSSDARFIVDTSNLTTSDKIKIQSMTDSSNVYTADITAVGTPVVIDVPSRDYYKVCAMKNISGTLTDMPGTYRESAYGDCHYIVPITAIDTLDGAQGVLDSHQELSLYSVGDEIKITVNGSEWVMQIGGINIYESHELILVSKNIYTNYAWNPGTVSKPKYAESPLKIQCDAFYNAILANDRALIKEKTVTASHTNNGSSISDEKVWLPTATEVFGVDTTHYSPEATSNVQFTIFTNQADRIRKLNGSNAGWFTASNRGNDTGGRYWSYVKADGSLDFMSYDNMTYGILPCFRLTANS